MSPETPSPADLSEGQRYAMDISHFCELFVERQKDHEAATKARIDELETKIDHLVLSLKDALATIETLVKSRTEWRPPGGLNASTN